MLKKILKNTLPLVIITLVSALLLSVVYEATKDKIAEAEEKEKTDSYYLIFPDAKFFDVISRGTVSSYVPASKATVNEAFVAKSESGEEEGIVLSVSSPNGYGGRIDLSIGVCSDGSISGIKVTYMNETSGLGSNCQNPEWLGQFVGKSSEVISFVRNGRPGDDEIDAISQATITTKAVLEAVNEGTRFARYYFGRTVDAGNE